jgi:hypothetical protein
MEVRCDAIAVVGCLAMLLLTAVWLDRQRQLFARKLMEEFTVIVGGSLMEYNNYQTFCLVGSRAQAVVVRAS